MTKKDELYQPASSDLVGPEILKLLGITVERCRSAVITLETGKPVVVEAEYYATMDADGDTRDLEIAVRRFRFVV